MRQMDNPVLRVGALLFVSGLGMAQTARFDIVNYGAVGDGKTNDAAAINRAVAAGARAGGGMVVVPPGDYVSGPITLLSNVTLHLEAGSTIRGSTRLEDYEAGPAQKQGPRDQQPISESGRILLPLITATNARNITITGRGVIDGSAMAFMKTDQVLDLAYAVTRGSNWIPKLTRQGEDFMSAKFGTQSSPFAFGPRPGNIIRINNCDNVLIAGVTLQNSPYHTLSIANTRNLDIRGIKINSLASDRRVPNDDGINLSNSRFVHISDSDIQTSDDSLALNGVENFTVTNCTLSSRDSGIRVGPGSNGIRNGTLSNLIIHTSTRGILLNVRGSGTIENLLFDNIVIQTQLSTGYWWGKGEPIHISALPRADGTSSGAVRNVRFSNILADSESGIVLYGTKEIVIRDVEFDRVKVKVRAGPLTASLGGNFDLRGANQPELRIFKHDIPGIYCGYVDGLKIRNLEVEWGDKLPEFFSQGIECENFQDLEVEGYHARQSQTDGKGSAISLSNGSGVVIRNSVAAEGTETFLTHTGITGGIILVNNDLSRAKVAISPAKAELTQSGNIMPPSGARKR